MVVLSFTKFVQFLSCKGLPELAGEGGTRQGGNGAPLSRIEPRSAPGDAVNDSLTLSVRVATREGRERERKEEKKTAQGVHPNKCRTVFGAVN